MIALAGCLGNPSVEVDKQSLELAQGTSSDVTVTIDGVAVDDFYSVVWEIDDPSIATVTPAWDGKRLRIGGSLEGDTLVRVNSHGQTLEIPTRVGPPAITEVWIEPAHVSTKVGGQVHVRAVALDTTLRLQDITHASRWTVRDTSVATLDMAGMMLQAMGEGATTLHVTHGELFTNIPITIRN